jgi:hypothetical protein
MKKTTFSPNDISTYSQKMSVVHETPQEEVVSVTMPVQETEDDDLENNTDKCIDFQSQLSALNKRTETELPHTLS